MKLYDEKIQKKLIGSTSKYNMLSTLVYRIRKKLVSNSYIVREKSEVLKDRT